MRNELMMLFTNWGDQVMLSTLNRWRDYKRTGEQRVAKFMLCFDGPYIMTDVNMEASTITLDIPQTLNLFPTFHSSHVKPFKPNDDIKFPWRTIDKPGPIKVDRVAEHMVDKIIDCKTFGNNFKYLVRWRWIWPWRQQMDFGTWPGKQWSNGPLARSTSFWSLIFFFFACLCYTFSHRVLMWACTDSISHHSDL